MRVLAHPLRRDAAGQVATVEQGSGAEAAQCALAVASTVLGERRLAPDFGLPDLAGVGLDADVLAAGLGVSEPDLRLVLVEVGPTGADGVQVAVVEVVWDEGEEL